MPKSFKELSEKEILALAITLEEEDGRTYADIANRLKDNYPDSATLFRTLNDEENEHRRLLTTKYLERFGDHIPHIRRQDIKGFISRKPVWWMKTMSLKAVRDEAASMEEETQKFYRAAAARTTDLKTRELLHQLADQEQAHIDSAHALSEQNQSPTIRDTEAATKKRRFILQIIQPGLAGLMDGSVSTLAPLFAAAFATGKNWDAFRVGLAASLGAGISMGFAEALSDDGTLTGRGKPLIRGIACGLMTTAGGIGHTLPYLIPDGIHGWLGLTSFRLATLFALVVVAFELAAISWIRHRFMESPWLRAAVQVVIGGIIVLIVGIVIGS